MRIKILSIDCNDLPVFQRNDDWYKPGERLTNFVVGEEYDVYAIAIASQHHYFVRITDGCMYLSPFPAALTKIVDPTIPKSWIVSHETKATNKKLPEHQVIFCPEDWLMPFFSMFIDLLTEDLDDDGQGEAIRRIFRASIQRDYPC